MAAPAPRDPSPDTEESRRRADNKKFTLDDLSQQQMADLRDAFKVFDLEGDGHINPQKLGKVMKKLGRNPTEAEVQDLIMAVDDDGNGQIEFEEFAIIMARQMQEETKEEELREAFGLFDRNSNGYVTADEIGFLLGSLGQNFSPEELADMVGVADHDGDKQITLQDFMTAFKDT